MKMRKILLISAAMMLSIGAYAQDEITHHWPEVQFTIVNTDGTATDGVVYTIPGWDAWLLNNDGYVNGHIRVQKYEKTGDEYKARLVTRYAIYGENRLYVPKLNASTVNVKIVGHEDIGVKNLIGLQYKDVFGTETGPDGTSYKVSILDATNTGTVSKITGEYKILVHMTHGNSGEVYNIDEIGAYAFRQPSRSGSEDKNYLQATKIIIPKEITKIERGAFFMNGHTQEIEFEEDCPVEEILEFNFQDNTSLQKIVFPASVKKLWGTVLGGCPALTRIEFKGVTPPATPTFTWSGKAYKVFESTVSGADATVPANCVMSVPLVSGASYAENELFTAFKLASPIAFPDSKIATCCSSLPFTVSDGMEAFYVKGEGIHENYVSLTAIDGSEILPDCEGFILIGTTGTEEIFYFNGEDDTFTPLGNKLVGEITDTQVTYNSSFLYYVLNTQGEFIPVKTSGTLPANKAYLKIGADEVINLSNSLSVTLPEETGIVSHETQKVQDNVYYTLQGTQVSQPQKGLVIRNGKKYIVK